MFDGLSTMTSFFAGFTHTGNGVTCSDSGFMDLSTAEECSGAVNYAKTFNGNARYVTITDNPTNHKGCFIYDSGSMYFNVHSTGGTCDSCTSICRTGNT